MLPYLAMLLGLAVVYFLAGKLGLSLAFVSKPFTSRSCIVPKLRSTLVPFSPA